MKKFNYLFIITFTILFAFNINTFAKNKVDKKSYSYFEDKNSKSFFTNNCIINQDYKFIFKVAKPLLENIKIIETNLDSKKYTALFTFNGYPKNENIFLELIAIRKDSSDYQSLLNDKHNDLIRESDDYAYIITDKESPLKNGVNLHPALHEEENNKNLPNKDKLFSEILDCMNGVNEYIVPIETKKIDNIDMIPIKEYIDLLGYKFDKKSTNKNIIISGNNNSFTIKPGNKNYKFNNSKKVFQAKPIIMDNVLYVPLTFLNNFR